VTVYYLKEEEQKFVLELRTHALPKYVLLFYMPHWCKGSSVSIVIMFVIRGSIVALEIHGTKEKECALGIFLIILKCSLSFIRILSLRGKQVLKILMPIQHVFFRETLIHGTWCTNVVCNWIINTVCSSICSKYFLVIYNGINRQMTLIRTHFPLPSGWMKR
jgi:hypothetical protein